MVHDEFTVPHPVHLSGLRVRRESTRAEDDGEQEALPAEERPGSVQYVANAVLSVALLRGNVSYDRVPCLSFTPSSPFSLFFPFCVHTPPCRVRAVLHRYENVIVACANRKRNAPNLKIPHHEQQLYVRGLDGKRLFLRNCRTSGRRHQARNRVLWVLLDEIF